LLRDRGQFRTLTICRHFAQDLNGSEDLGDDFSIIKMTI